MRTAAFFDMDKTLLAVNSAPAWIKSEVAAGHLSRSVALRAMFRIFQYHMGTSGMEGAVLKLLRETAGHDEKKSIERVEKYYQNTVRNQYRRRALEVLEEHRASGHHLCLLTSSSQYMSELVSIDLKLDGYLCTVLEAIDGTMTGRVSGAMCYGQGKRHAAEIHAQTHGLDLAQSYFYTDSMADLPALEVVGFPVAVNPDRKLRGEASRRGWPCVDWGKEMVLPQATGAL